jgi:hypothetical protein
MLMLTQSKIGRVYRQRFAQLGVLFLSSAFAVALLGTLTARAATPASGSVTSATGSSVTWTGDATATGAANGEGDCIDGTTCDVFELTISGNAADYQGKVVAIVLSWTLGTNDYDLVVHKDTVDGPIIGTSGNGPPLVGEKAAIRPSITGTGVYVVHVLYFAGTPLVDQYHGTATTQLEPPVRTANYLKGGISFSPNITVKCPVARRDGEPSSRTDFKGNFYAAGIRGFPAGVDLWYFDLNPTSLTYDPLMRNPIYKDQPDGFSPNSAADLGGDGGGDVDLSVGFGIATGQTNPTLAFSSLILANVSTGNSFDLANTYQKNNAGNANGGVPVNDREWQEFFDDHVNFLTYRTFDPVIGIVQRSTDGGFSYEPGTSLGGVAQNGGIDVNHSDGTVYVSYNDGRVAVGIPAAPGLAPTSYTFHDAAVTEPNGPGHLFCVIKAAEDGTPNGTVYVCYSNGKDVFLTHSTDKAVTWSLPVRVSDLPGGTSFFPAIETGPSLGSVAIAWYGAANQPYNNNDANWKVYFAQSFNATANTPTFTQVEASDHFVHGSNISEGGLNGSANRNLLDYFQISFDPQGAAAIAYTDDHNDFTGHVYVTRQIAGPSIKGGQVTLPNPIPTLSPPPGEAAPPPQPGPNGEQVTDFAQDAANGSNLTRIQANNPTDILSIKYSSSGTGPTLMLTAAMKVSDLTAVPPSATYRMNFTANAPDSFLSASGDYTYGLSDRGDKFFVSVTTDQAGAPTFHYGTAVRNSDGTVTYTNRGIADSGSIDQGNGTLTVNVAVDKLNALLPGGSSPIGIGSALVGLRGSASGGQQSDETRGGTLFVVGGGRVSAVSRKTHGDAGQFDINLPLTGNPGIECRTGGASGDYQVVIRFPFASTVVMTGGVTLNAPQGGSISNFSVNGREVTINLTGIINAQTVTVTLTGVNDGTNVGTVVVPMSVLLGDTTANGLVNSSDVAQTQSQSGQAVNLGNFREDVTVNGAINSSDVALVQSKSGTGLGANPQTVEQPTTTPKAKAPRAKTGSRQPRNLQH